MTPITFAQVDLGALKSNLDAIRLRTDAAVLLPVKANAYGHGAVRVAQAADRGGWADWFGVATVGEGVALAKAGVTKPILKLSSTLPDEVGVAIDHGLRLTVTDRAGVAEAARVAKARGGIARLHLKVDTGMGRLGVEPSQAPGMAELIEANPHLDLEGVFTHFAVSDKPKHDGFTRGQLGRFRDCVDSATQRIGRRPLIHAANSGAVLSYPESWFDMVRPGILSYGYYPDPTSPRSVPVTPVMSLITHLTYVKTVHAGSTVGYGRTWQADRDTRVGTFPVGYGDGYDRRLSNCVNVVVAGHSYPQIGLICMDQSMVDLGPTSTIRAGEKVTLMGHDGRQDIDAEALATRVGTISYAMLCGIAARVPRVYVDGQ
ncbi:MAG: alanine racemase [Propionibacteriaceae bacterium]|jgi:alanine racemase|nr:alanine racemase [Propionibacteriaceae bacterium]